jgi:hypothetical protein
MSRNFSIFCPNRAACKCTWFFRQQSVVFHFIDAAVTVSFPATKCVPNLHKNNNLNTSFGSDQFMHNSEIQS